MGESVRVRQEKTRMPGDDVHVEPPSDREGGEEEGFGLRVSL